MRNLSFDKYFYEPKNVSQIKDSAYIVVDTNVLLSAYQWKEVTLKEVLEVLRRLSTSDRLRIPSHVFREFIDQRPKRILEVIQKIDKELHSKLQRPPKLESLVPFLDMIDQSEEYYALEQKYLEVYDGYRKKTTELSNRIKSFLYSDPVLDMLKEIIEQSYFELPSDELEKVDEEAKERAANKIPPLTGGDSGKKENSAGDFLIWKHILSLDRDVIFVTTDTKSDWVLKDHHDNILSPRRELVEEFYEKNINSTFSILSPKDFVALYKPSLSDSVSFDLEANQRKKKKILDALRKIFNDHDPSGLYSFSEDVTEYDPEIDSLIENLPNCHSIEGTAALIKDIFEKMLWEEGKSQEEYYEMASEILYVKKKYGINDKEG